MIISLSFLSLPIHSVLTGKQGNGTIKIPVCAAGFSVVRSDSVIDSRVWHTWGGWSWKYTTLLEWSKHVKHHETLDNLVKVRKNDKRKSLGTNH